MSEKKSRALMILIYFAGALLLMGLGGAIINSGFEGYHWYQQYLGSIIPIPTEELFAGMGGFIGLLGLMLAGAGVIEMFFCPTCPFTMNKRWESPTIER